MSKRRKSGDWVWLSRASGFIENSNKHIVQIIGPNKGRDGPEWCMLDCGDPDCREWPNVETKEINGIRYNLCHVSECQMFDDMQS